MTEEKKQKINEVKKEGQKEVKKVLKLCPFISGFVMEIGKDLLGNQGLVKTNNVSPCIANKCMFYNETEQYCKIVKGLDDIHNSFKLEDEQDEEEIQGEGTDE